MWLSNRKGQSTVEIAVLFAVIVGALVAMQIYLKRGAMGKLRETADQIGEQFSPTQTSSSLNTSYSGARHDTTHPTGLVTSDITQDEVQSRSAGQQSTGALSAETIYQ